MSLFEITPEMVRDMRRAAEELPNGQTKDEAYRNVELWEKELERQNERARLIAEAANRGDFQEALILSDSQERPPIFARAGRELDGDALREIVTHWWSNVEAWGGNPELREGVMNALRKVAPVIVPSDDPGRLQKPPEGRFKVYRGNLGELPSGGSWTLDKDVAIMFARMATGPRGQIVLGYPADGTGTVWSADVDSEDVLGFFDDRTEYEIVTDRVRNVEKVGELVSAPRDPFGIGAEAEEAAS